MWWNLKSWIFPFQTLLSSWNKLLKLMTRDSDPWRVRWHLTTCIFFLIRTDLTKKIINNKFVLKNRNFWKCTLNFPPLKLRQVFHPLSAKQEIGNKYKANFQNQNEIKWNVNNFSMTNEILLVVLLTMKTFLVIIGSELTKSYNKSLPIWHIEYPFRFTSKAALSSKTSWCQSWGIRHL